MFTQRGAKKKILAMLVILGLAGSAVLVAVDTKETTSVAPIAENYIVHTDPALRNLARHGLEDDGRPSRSTPRPTLPTVKPTVKPTKPPVVKPRAKIVKLVKKVIKHPVYKKKTVKKSRKVSLSGIAACIAKYESGGNPRAENPSSTASGLFQFINGTWNHFGGYARAMYAPASVQLEKFYQVWNGGRGAVNWVTAYKCGY